MNNQWHRVSFLDGYLFSSQGCLMEGSGRVCWPIVPGGDACARPAWSAAGYLVVRNKDAEFVPMAELFRLCWPKLIRRVDKDRVALVRRLVIEERERMEVAA